MWRKTGTKKENRGMVECENKKKRSPSAREKKRREGGVKVEVVGWEQREWREEKEIERDRGSEEKGKNSKEKALTIELPDFFENGVAECSTCRMRTDEVATNDKPHNLDGYSFILPHLYLYL